MTADVKDNRFDTTHLRDDLKGHSLRGGSSVLFSQTAVFVLRIGSTAVLARILQPTDFGLVAMGVTVAAFADIFKDIGLSVAVIQWDKISHAQASNLFWVNAAAGLLTMAALIVFSPVMVWFYDEPRLFRIGVYLSVMFLFGGLTSQHSALLKRQMRFGWISLSEVLSVLLSVLAAMALALHWRSRPDAYMALVWMMITRPFFFMMAVWWICRWRPGRMRRHTGTAALLKFGAGITGFNIVNYAARNADNILIGKFCGSAPLAFYSKAYQFLLLPIQQFRAPLVSVATPALSALQYEPDGYRRYMGHLLAILAFVSMPFMVYVGVFTDYVVLFFFGDQWREAIPFFRIFALVGFIQPIAGMCGLVLTTTGKSRRYFAYGCIQGGVLTASFAAGIAWGAMGVVIAYAAANYIALLPLWRFCFAGTPVDTGLFLRSVRQPALNSLAMGAILWYGSTVLPVPTAVLPAFMLTLLLSVAVYAGLYGATVSGRRFLAIFTSHLCGRIRWKRANKPQSC